MESKYSSSKSGSHLNELYELFKQKNKTNEIEIFFYTLKWNQKNFATTDTYMNVYRISNSVKHLEWNGSETNTTSSKTNLKKSIWRDTKFKQNK